MSEQPIDQNSNSTPTLQIEKLLIDNPLNFQFHAAYMVYSEAFDKANEDAKKELNQNIEDLQNSKIDNETFYQNVSRYRKLEQMPRQGGKFTVTTQRKKDWRMKTQKQERIRRHKK